MRYAVRPGLPDSPTTAQVLRSSSIVSTVAGSCQSGCSDVAMTTP